jgi:hypothetical protein
MTSLQKAIESEAFAINTIKLGVNNSAGKNLLWIIVEADDDVSLYKKLFNSKSTMVLSPHREENKNGGCQNLLIIVERILNEGITDRIIGIRDKDCIFFKDPQHQLPKNIFATDTRDLEMMMLKSENVKSEFNKQYNTFNEHFSKSLETARKIGCLHIHNQVDQCMCDFHMAISWQKLLDTRSGDLVNNWKQLLIESFNANNTTSTILDINEYDKIFVRYQTIDDYEVCRGHDMVTLLSNYIKHNLSKKKIHLILIEHYSCEDFKKTDLYASINAWILDNHLNACVLN